MYFARSELLLSDASIYRGSIGEMFRALDPFTGWAFDAGDNKKPMEHVRLYSCVYAYVDT